ncbi:hypothetical protein A7Q09_01480 [Methylacidiphilum sp. Yel]|jgi:GT2 family glycosyltransferase|uniref:glycosyltransferase family 2 protein n=1 Tax=Methylacidiphilum sp. Yel TaxID=1847730 RepID=UPI00106BC4D7|nr:glycosyltransferase family 2 protein [Methylacidiphilum sp. Yel]TFE67156.1 hypothetical protein A7Q09_01480 [Methylacidiphilum sp. Yel]
MENIFKLGIIVPTWNSEKDLKPLLESFQQLTCKHQIEKIVFVDSGSKDRTVDLLCEIQKIPQNILPIKVLQLDRDKGYAHALNQGIYTFNNYFPNYLLFSNPDVIYPRFFLDKILEEVKGYETLNIGIIGPRVLAPIGNGKWQEENLRPRNLWGIPQYRPKDQKVYFVHSTHGASLLVKKEVLEKIGFFDEDYFLYWDEHDFCTRARKAGFSIVIVNTISILHHPSEIRSESQNKSKIFLYYQYRNQFLFAKKNYGLISQCLFLCIRFLVFVRELINYILKKQWAYAKTMSLGFLRGLLNEKGISKLSF